MRLSPESLTEEGRFDLMTTLKGADSPALILEISLLWHFAWIAFVVEMLSSPISMFELGAKAEACESISFIVCRRSFDES